jgi:hypothetical protein
VKESSQAQLQQGAAHAGWDQGVHVQEFLRRHSVNPLAEASFRRLPPEQQKMVMSMGPLSGPDHSGELMHRVQQFASKQPRHPAGRRSSSRTRRRSRSSSSSSSSRSRSRTRRSRSPSKRKVSVRSAAPAGPPSWNALRPPHALHPAHALHSGMAPSPHPGICPGYPPTRGVMPPMGAVPSPLSPRPMFPAGMPYLPPPGAHGMPPHPGMMPHMAGPMPPAWPLPRPL